MVLADVAGTGDYHLVLTDLKFNQDTKCRLKVYKGTLLVSDQPLPDIPSSVVSFYADQLEPRIPVVAVACGSELFAYKNLKPFYKFRVPFCPLVDEEAGVWTEVTNSESFGADKLNALKAIPYASLSARSQYILNQTSPILVEELLRKCGKTMPTKENIITCMASMARSSRDRRAIACPIIATEFGSIFVLDPQNFAILHQANTCNVKATPFIIKSTGLFDVEFRLLIATREGHICLLRKGWLEGKCLIQLTSDIVDMVAVPGDNFVIVATSDKALHCYSKKGQRLWSTTTANLVTCMSLVPLEHISTCMVAIGLKNGSIQLYQGRQPVDFTSVADSPSVITFGQLGQEEHVMVVITIGGSISFKILKRTADFSSKVQENSPMLQSRPLPLPKRSKLFLEQSIRERKNALEIHQTFQQDLIRLRLSAARALVQNLSDQSGIGNEKEQLKLSAQVLGLGPKFTVILSLENINPNNPLVGLCVTFHVNPLYYVLSLYAAKVPLIPPSLSYKLETKVEEVIKEGVESDDLPVGGEKGNCKVIRVFVTRELMPVPVLAATINMPPTELIV
ncbi:Bardet-Biedl syndrome 1 protein homolog isoform X2 [Dendroctonus ponderosae]|nr:Bardet-Biedl syndrome 1 protein homolog isoform X2 [Dendroctonus ponderosae]XP_048522414.1 Bardet-Biedl syndrome 1 protein homolog isoform X2 [Dendroctonus ponderosae]